MSPILVNRMHAAAFMAQGLALPANEPYTFFNNLLNHWDGGHTELVNQLVRYAPYAEALVEAGYAITGDFPGVVAYEVYEEFGSWYGRTMLKLPTLSLPGAADARAQLRKLAYDFFVPGCTDEQRQQLDVALASVLPEPRYAVETLVGHDWENVSRDQHGKLVTFATHAEALVDLVVHAYNLGDAGMHWEADDYRIAEVWVA